MDLKPRSQDKAFIFQRLGWDVDIAPAAMAAAPVVAEEPTVPPAPAIEIAVPGKTAKADSER